MCYGLSLSSALAGDYCSPGFARAVGSSRSSSDALLAVASEDALARGSETGSVLVDGEGSSLDGGSIRDTCAGSSPVFGRVLFRVGRSPTRSTRVRGVVRPGEVAVDESSGNEGPLSGLQAFREDDIGHHVSAMCDNSTVVAYINKQRGTVSPALCLLTSHLLR